MRELVNIRLSATSPFRSLRYDAIPMPQTTEVLLKRIRLRLILALALLLPLGQVASTWHLLSHLHGDQRSGQTDADRDDHCDLCIAAAAVLGGAPGAQPVVMLAPSPLPNPQPVVDAPTLWSSLIRCPYLSRAPPVA